MSKKVLYASFFVMGFFSLAAQVLLFRDYLSVLENHELASGAFFAFWLLWIALGAWAGRLKIFCFTEGEKLIPLYLPAFLVQDLLLLTSRSWAGGGTYEILGIAGLLMVSFFANGILSFMTGFLFALLCRNNPSGKAGEINPALFYTWECLGGVLGASGSLYLLGGENPPGMFSGLSVFLLFIPWIMDSFMKKFLKRSGILLSLALFSAWFCASDTVTSFRHGFLWKTFVRETPLQSFFYTSQGLYLTGENKGEWMVFHGKDQIESYPGSFKSHEILPLLFSETDFRKQVLIAGSNGLSLAGKLNGFREVENIACLSTDPAYGEAVKKHIPGGFQKEFSKVSFPEQDLRKFLANQKGKWDICFFDLPSPFSLYLNRFYSKEFFEQVRAALKPSGVLFFNFDAGENVMGEEIALWGALLEKTVKNVFKKVILKPGERSLWIASMEAPLSEDPQVLFNRIRNRKEISPESVLSLFPGDRIQFQLKEYERVLKNYQSLLLILDESLEGVGFYLSHAGKKISLALLPVLKLFQKMGVIFWIWAFVFWWVLRILYTGLKGLEREEKIRLNSLEGIGITGFMSMGLQVSFMFLQEVSDGSLFYHMAGISALYMLGSGGTGFAVYKGLSSGKVSPSFFTGAGFFFLMFSGGYGALIFFQTSFNMILFLSFLNGAGASMILCASVSRFEKIGGDMRIAGSLLEGMDHAGAFFGAVLAGVFFPLILGPRITFFLLLMTGFTGLIFWAFSFRKDRFFLFSGFSDRVSLGVFWSISVLIIYYLFSYYGGGPSETESRKVLRDSSSHLLTLNTKQYASEVTGYGGPMELEFEADSSGRLQNIRVLSHQETEYYMNKVIPWMESLKGLDLVKGNLSSVDVVSGATYTCDAVLKSIEQTVNRDSAFKKAFQQAGAHENKKRNFRAGANLLLWLFFWGWAIRLRVTPKKSVKILFLILLSLFMGSLNIQYSLDSLFRLWEGHWQSFGITASFLAWAVPLSVVLCGNTYCGYLCPFGALQELISYLRPSGWNLFPSRVLVRFFSSIKYILLIAFLTVYAFSGNRHLCSADFLTSFFQQLKSLSLPLFPGIMLGISFFYPRFWCRCFCPSGAFLNLLNGFKIISELIPRVNPGRCPMRLNSGEEMSCLHCDQCRYSVNGS